MRQGRTVGGGRRSGAALPSPKNPGSFSRGAFCRRHVSPATRVAAAFRHSPSSMHHLPREDALRECKSRFFLRASRFFVCLSPCARTPGSAALPCSSPARLKLAGVLPESGWSYHHHLSPWSPRLWGHKDQHHAVPQVTARCHEGPPNRGWGLSGHFHHPTAPKAFLTLV